MAIWIDNRELRSVIPKQLKRFGVEIAGYRNLIAGDYLVQGVETIPVERKDVHDYVNSLVSGRLNNELYKLSFNYPISLLVVEGFVEDVLIYGGVKRSAYFSSLVGSFIKKAPLGEGGIINLICVNSAYDTAQILRFMDEKLKSVDGMIRLPKAQKIPIRKEKQLLHSIACFPGIGEVRARDLLSHFGTYRNLVCASLKELEEVKGIGRKTAVLLYNLFNLYYEEGDKE